MLLRGEVRKYAKNVNFENVESSLYLTSGSMPLTENIVKKGKTENNHYELWFEPAKKQMCGEQNT